MPSVQVRKIKCMTIFFPLPPQVFSVSMTSFLSRQQEVRIGGNENNYFNSWAIRPTGVGLISHLPTSSPLLSLTWKLELYGHLLYILNISLDKRTLIQTSALFDVQVTKGFMKTSGNMKSHLKCLTRIQHEKVNIITGDNTPLL